MNDLYAISVIVANGRAEFSFYRNSTGGHHYNVPSVKAVRVLRIIQRNDWIAEPVKLHKPGKTSYAAFFRPRGK